MKKYIFLLFCLFYIDSNAQVNFLDKYYFDCVSSSYNVNLGISLSVPEGNYKKAKELLDTDFFKKNLDDATKIQALLIHNTLGYEKAILHIENAKISQENKEFTQLWLNFYTNNTEQFDLLLVTFQKKYPTNYNPLKLKFRTILNYRDANIWNKLEDQKSKSITTLDSLLAVPNINKEDKTFFLLMKLDFLKKKEFNSDEREYLEEELLDILVVEYQKNKPIFDLGNLKYNLNKSKSKKYKILIEEINDKK
jgi:hypothetical protein